MSEPTVAHRKEVTPMAQYTATYEFSDGSWFVEIPAVKACFTQGETLHEARANIREVLSLMTSNEEAESAEIVDAMKLPDSVTEALHDLSESPALRTLADYGIPVADVGVLLGSAPI